MHANRFGNRCLIGSYWSRVRGVSFDARPPARDLLDGDTMIVRCRRCRCRRRRRDWCQSFRFLGTVSSHHRNHHSQRQRRRSFVRRIMPPPPTSSSSSSLPPRQHGVKGVYYGGDWLDLEDCAGRFFPNNDDDDNHNIHCHPDCDRPCPRSRSRHRRTSSSDQVQVEETNEDTNEKEEDSYAVLIIGAGCIGAAIARELSKVTTRSTNNNNNNKNNNRHSDNHHVLWVEAADDVSQGATKGNSGIVHAGYDDTPGSVRAKYCWPGNQSFAALDRELRFGYQTNGSLVVAVHPNQVQELHQLYQRGQANGVQRLRIITDRDELFQMEPHLTKDAIAALYAPDAGNVIPYEYTIALAENAVDNGIDLRIRRRVTKIECLPNKHSNNTNNSGSGTGTGGFRVTMEHWEPTDYVQAVARQSAARSGRSSHWSLVTAGSVASVMVVVHYFVTAASVAAGAGGGDMRYHLTALVALWMAIHQMRASNANNNNKSEASANGTARGDGSVWKDDAPLQRLTTPLIELVQQAGRAIGTGHQAAVQVTDMLLGGSGSPTVQHGTVVAVETVRCQYIVNCAGGAADQIAHLIGDDSFQIKPRLGDYLLLNRNQVRVCMPLLFGTGNSCRLLLTALCYSPSLLGRLFFFSVDRATWQNTRFFLVPILFWARVFWSKPHYGVI